MPSSAEYVMALSRYPYQYAQFTCEIAPMSGATLALRSTALPATLPSRTQSAVPSGVRSTDDGGVAMEPTSSPPLPTTCTGTGCEVCDSPVESVAWAVKE